MTGEEAVEYIRTISRLGSKPGSERVEELLERLGCPHRLLKCIHIAGTNGKGSTAAMLASVFQKAGYRTGLYTSPVLQRLHEGMQVDGVPISDGELGEIVSLVRPHAEAMADQPTEFEVMTCAAFLWFSRRGCDIVVMEAGLGGRLDATNVIEAPELSILTALGLDHTEWLGGTVEEIAAEKAGIFKKGCPVVVYRPETSVLDLLTRAAQERGCPLSVSDPAAIHVRKDDLSGQIFDYGVWEEIRLPLLGGHQRENAAVVLEAVSRLREKGWTLPDRAVYEGLAAVRWPGRFEVLRHAPLIIADGGHNPQCAGALAKSLAAYLPHTPIHFLLGVLADKDWRTMVDRVAPLAASFTVTTPQSPRALPPEELERYLVSRGIPVTLCPEMGDALHAVLERAGSSDAVCIFGSLYLVGAVRPLLV